MVVVLKSKEHILAITDHNWRNVCDCNKRNRPDSVGTLRKIVLIDNLLLLTLKYHCKYEQYINTILYRPSKL